MEPAGWTPSVGVRSPIGGVTLEGFRGDGHVGVGRDDIGLLVKVDGS